MAVVGRVICLTGVPALEYFADYIDGKVEFVKLAAKIWGVGEVFPLLTY